MLKSLSGWKFKFSLESGPINNKHNQKPKSSKADNKSQNIGNKWKAVPLCWFSPDVRVFF